MCIFVLDLQKPVPPTATLTLACPPLLPFTTILHPTHRPALHPTHRMAH
ncbi:MAG: hypothetical protein IJ814_00775 [Paludibacteraceae bacterium]|nr:hypothetical protein [Paludibacteraceae bacterium]